MKKQNALKTIMWISIAGILFSGYLSYSEIFKKVCALGTCASVGGVPACVYGLIMYIIVLIIATLGIKSKR